MAKALTNHKAPTPPGIISSKYNKNISRLKCWKQPSNETETNIEWHLTALIFANYCFNDSIGSHQSFELLLSESHVILHCAVIEVQGWVENQRVVSV